MSGSAAFVPKGYSAYTTVGSAQQSAIAAALTVIGELWVNGMLNTSTKGHGSVLQRLDAVHTVKEGYFQPYTTGSCAVDAIDGPHDASPMSFPVPSGVREDTLDRIEINDTVLSGWPSLVCPGVTKDQIYGIPGSPEEFRLKWVELPQDPFNGSAIGAIILLPRSPANSTQDIMVCNLGAGWGSSIMNTSSDGNTPMTSIIDLSTTNTAIGDDLHTNYSSVYQLPPAEGKASNTVSAFFLPYFPQKPIVVTEDWARYLNPFVSAVNKTVIDILMSPEPGARPGPEGFISTAETALILLLANGLSNIGAASTLQGDIRTVKRPSGRRKIDGDYWFSAKGDMFVVDPQESKDWVQIRVHSTINGYAYTIRSAASKVAISFLLAYCVLALSHVLYAAISGKKLLGILVSEFIVDDLGVSSTCWDSIGEVTALAMNSTPTTLLRNTCAGIMELDIFKIPVRVLAVRDSEGDGEHLELVFGDVDEKEVRGTRIKPNRVYGTLPRMPQNEKSE
ncbi:MAG: hypothetical protein L6R42_003830 [Xanthoria sp. 1 TBL-2021]|nr:MAG: hypothetical protein L6R42_003830 [Xanthoria sp. 1 TBL-2021]